MAETLAHRNLKHAGVAFLLAQGCAAVAPEVRCPICRYVVDVAGYADVAVLPAAVQEDAQPLRVPRGQRVAPATWMIECKQERGDFLRDSAKREKLLRKRDELHAARIRLEDTWIKPNEPHLRRSRASLFAECEEWDFASTSLRSYHELLRELRKLDKQLTGTTKFCMIANYRLADWLYIAAPAGLLGRRDLPAGWGLLEWSATATALTISVPAPRHDARSDFRQRLLRNVATAATRAVLREASGFDAAN